MRSIEEKRGRTAVALAGGSLVALVLAALVAGAAEAAPPIPAPPLGCAPPTADRVALYRAEGTAEDSVQGLDGSLVNGVGLGYAPGVLGQAFDLPGDGDHVAVPDAAALNVTADLTLDAWVKIDDTNFANPSPTGVGGGRVIFWKVDAADLNLTYSFFIEGDTLATPLAFASGDRAQPGSRTFSQPLQWQADRWYHVAAARSGRTVAFYRDGEPVGTDALGQDAIATPGAPLALGAAPLPDAVYNPLKGDLDEAAIWNRALSADEIKAIQETGTGACRQPPDTTIDSGPSGPGAPATPTFTFSSNDPAASFQCRLDGAEFTPCATPRGVGPLAFGEHSFEVRAVDDRGVPDPTPAGRTFTVTQAPPRNAGLPLILNTAERYVYRCIAGNWEGRDPARPYIYTWQRLTPDRRFLGGIRADDVATGDTYRPVQGPPAVNPPSMLFQCVVQASNAGGSTSAVSQSRTLEAAPAQRPVNPAYGNFRIRGIDVFQVVQPNAGAQQYGLNPMSPFTNYPGGGTPTDWRNPANPQAIDADPQSVEYDGVALDPDKLTRAVVFVDVEDFEPSDRTQWLDVTLQMRRSGGGVILSQTQRIRGIINLPASTTPFVTARERADFGYGVQFQIARPRDAGPSDSFSLSATVRFAPGTLGLGTRECDAGPCTADNRFTLRDVQVASGYGDLVMAPIMLFRAGQNLRSPFNVLARARAVLPNLLLTAPGQYRDQIDITDATNAVATAVANTPNYLCNGVTYPPPPAQPPFPPPTAAQNQAAAQRACRSAAVSQLVDTWSMRNPARVPRR